MIKGHIDREGTLFIEGETELENYALSKWLDDWNSKKAKFSICLPNPNKPSTVIPTPVKTFEEI